MAKQPNKTNPSPRELRAGRSQPEAAGAEPGDGQAASRAFFEAEVTELDVIETELSGVAAGDRLRARSDELGAGAGRASDLPGGEAGSGVGEEGRRSSSGRGAGRFGPSEWLALAGCAVVAVAGALLFFKFLYAHPAPTRAEKLPLAFAVPLSGGLVTLSGAEVGWRDRVDGDKAQAEEAVVPTAVLELAGGAASSGFVRVEFVDADDKIRGDIMTVAVEGGRFVDGGRGEVVEEGGLRLRLAGTVGFRSQALFGSYLVGDEPRWSVRIKEGGDYSNGPWNPLGAAVIPNKKLTSLPTTNP